MESSNSTRQSISRRRFLGLVATGTGAAVLAACATTVPTSAPGAGDTTAPTTAAPAAGGTFTFGNPQVGVIPTWLPWKPLSSAQSYHWLWVYSKLARYDKAAEIQPDLAESWEVSEDGLTYTFKLRPGVKWHDGTPFTAKDVAFTYQAALLPEAGSTISALLPFKGAKEFQEHTAETCEGIQALDDLTIEFTLDVPNAAMWDQFTSLNIAPAHPFEGIADPAEWLTTSFSTDKPIGTGPFVFTEYVPDQHVIMEANPDYFRGRPKIDRAITKFFGDANVLLIAIEKGEIDYSKVGLDAETLAKARTWEHIVLDEYRYPGVSFLSLSFTREWWQDKRARQAVLYAIDRETIAREVFQGTNMPAVPVSYWTAEWALSENLNPYPYDPEKAKALLAEANWDTEMVHDLIWFGDKMPDHFPIIQQQLEAVGIKTKLVQTERSRIMNIFYETSDYDMCFLGGYGSWQPWGARIELACDVFYPDGWNSMHFCNEEMDEILKNGPTETDEAKRAEMYKRGSEIFNEELPYIPLFRSISYTSWHKRVKGWEDQLTGQWDWNLGVWDCWNWTLEA